MAFSRFHPLCRFPRDIQPGPQPVRSNWRTSLTLAAMSLGYGVVQLDVTIVNTALNSIGTSLGGGVRSCNGWSAPTPSRLPRSFSPQARSATVSARSGSSWRALRSSPRHRCLRAGAERRHPDRGAGVQGLGAAILVPNSLALLSHAYPDEKQRGRAVGIWAAGASLALTAGPLVGGGLIALVGWRSIFLVNLPIGLAGLWLTLALCQRDPAIAAARDRSARPGRGDRRARLSRRRHHRRRHAGLGQSFRDRGFCRVGGAGGAVRPAGTRARRNRCCRCRCSGIGCSR